MVAALAGLAGYYSNRASDALEGASEKLMLASFADLDGKAQSLSQWRGKVLVLNFWATWCAPCREEIPALIRTHKKYAANNIQLVGIGVDNASKIREYAAETGMDYPLLVAGLESLEVSKDLGNRAGVLPFTVVLNRSGKVVYTHAGALTEATLSAILAPLL